MNPFLFTQSPRSSEPWVFQFSVKSGTEVAQAKIKKSANAVFTDVSVGAAGGT